MTALALEEVAGTYPSYPTNYKPLINPAHWPAILAALTGKKIQSNTGKGTELYCFHVTSC